MNQSSILRLLRHMTQEYRPIRKNLIWLLPIMFFVAAAQILEPYVYKEIIDMVTRSSDGSPDLVRGLFPVLWGWIAVVLLSIWLEFFANYRYHRLMQRQWSTVIGAGIRSILSKSYGYHLQVNNAEKIKLFNRGVDASYDLVNEIVMKISRSVLILIGYLGLAFITNWQLTLLVIAIIPVLLIAPIWAGNKAHAAQKSVTRLWDDVYGKIGDAITNVTIIKLFSRIGFARSKSEDSVNKAANAQASVSIFWSFLEAGGNTINLVLSVFVLGVSVWFYAYGHITLGEVILFLTVAGRISGPFLALENSYRNIARYSADYSKYRDVLDMPSEPDTGIIPFPEKYREIRFDKVSFSYPTSEREVLSGVDIILERGKKTALVGHTGSGKSTIISLLTRFYDPTGGSICLDAIPVQNIALGEYRSRFAAVFQDTTLFNDTLLANLEYVRDGLDRETIRRACADANILEFIESLPDGFNTIVGERGLKLSGGEKQRISIARAVLANPEILILDEATSALDAKTEKLVSESLEKLMEWRTSVIVAHRLSTIRRADRIYLLEGGKVLWSGDHDSLYHTSPVYREMVDYQRNGFVE